jgi:hypothetical protein
VSEARRYDAIGRSYVGTREEDPRIAAARLAADLESGPWAERNADILELDALDVGCRLLVTW